MNVYKGYLAVNADSMKITVASWNIWVHGRQDFRGIADLIRRNRIDIIGMQEAGIYPDERNVDMAKRIAEELGFHYAFYKTDDLSPDYNCIQGNAVISRFPMASKHYVISKKSKKAKQSARRVLVCSAVRIGNGKKLNFLTTHLMYSRGFKSKRKRIAQVNKLIKIAKRLKGPIVLTGDFNSVPENREMRKLGRFLNRTGGNRPTFAVHPFRDKAWVVKALKYRLDNIFISRELRLREFQIMKSGISDHLPIKAVIEV